MTELAAVEPQSRSKVRGKASEVSSLTLLATQKELDSLIRDGSDFSITIEPSARDMVIPPLTLILRYTVPAKA